MTEGQIRAPAQNTIHTHSSHFACATQNTEHYRNAHIFVCVCLYGYNIHISYIWTQRDGGLYTLTRASTSNQMRMMYVIIRIKVAIARALDARACRNNIRSFWPTLLPLLLLCIWLKCDATGHQTPTYLCWLLALLHFVRIVHVRYSNASPSSRMCFMIASQFVS